MENTKKKCNNIMWIPIISGILMLIGVVLLVLSTLPMNNTLDDNTLTVHFVVGKKTIDMTDAQFKPIPEDVYRNIIRTCGTSIGKKHSGRFMNTKTKNKYRFYLTGKGEKVYFEIGDIKYLVDDITISHEGLSH